MDCVIRFRDALQASFELLDWLPEPDGAIRRFHVPGDRQGCFKGWYLLFADGIASVCFGSWRGSGMFKDGAGCLFGGSKHG